MAVASEDIALMLWIVIALMLWLGR
jgi:hypothetical protein